MAPEKEMDRKIDLVGMREVEMDDGADFGMEGLRGLRGRLRNWSLLRRRSGCGETWVGIRCCRGHSLGSCCGCDNVVPSPIYGDEVFNARRAGDIPPKSIVAVIAGLCNRLVFRYDIFHTLNSWSIAPRFGAV